MATQRFQMGYEQFGPLIDFLYDDNVTGIAWNGRALWITDLNKGRYKSDIVLADSFVKTLAVKISNHADKKFNYSEPAMCVETDELRISVFEKSIANGKYSIVIRKTPAVRRLNERKMLSEEYADVDLLMTMINFMTAGFSIMVVGDPGSGKTEFVKYLCKFIPNNERTVTIEDTYELRLSVINPDLDVVELQINEKTFTYRQAIKECLRHDPQTLIPSEIRGKEAFEFIEAASTGLRTLSTMHCGSVENAPDRFVNMIGVDGEEKRNDFYSFQDVLVRIQMQTIDGKIHRRIEQIALLDRIDGKNVLKMFYDDGVFDYTAFDGLKKFQRRFKQVRKKVPRPLTPLERQDLTIKLIKMKG